MPRRFLILALAAALLITLAGCGKDSGIRTIASPGIQSATSAPQFLKTPAPPHSQTLGLRGIDPADPAAQAFRKQYVLASLGGKVACGRYQVTIPPGALQSDTWITVRDDGQGYADCNLEPHGIRFLKPVRLQMYLGDLSLGPYTDWTIFWMNDKSLRWEDQHATFDGATVTTYLRHFSEYAAGRGGW